MLPQCVNIRERGQMKGNKSDVEKYKGCNGCGQTKPHSEFYKDNRPGRDIQSKCKACQKAYRLARIDKDKENKAAYYQANKPKFYGYHRKRYEKFSDEIRQKSKQWRADNPEKFANQLLSWRLANPEKHNEAGQKRRARQKANGVFSISQKELKRLYSSVCFYCGAIEPITLDHVVPIALGGRHSIGNIVPACRPCNTSKKDRLLITWLKR